MTDYRTAEQAEAQLAAAAQAVADFYDSTLDTPPAVREHRARREVYYAIFLDKISTARIAAAAGVEKLWVALLVDDVGFRGVALAGARHAADRYTAQVMAAIRHEAMTRWRKATNDGQRPAPRGTKTEICKDLDIAIPTLDAWIASDPWIGGAGDPAEGPDGGTPHPAADREG